MSSTTTLIPNFYKNFSCIGPACEHDCCQNWRIDIDRKTYKNYRKSNSPDLIKFTEEMVRPRQQTEHDYRRVKLNDKGRCPLQNADGSCYVHQHHGEQFLSTTCKTYPRKNTFQANRIEASLTLSCPEAARKILLDPSAMHIEQNGQLPPHTQVLKINNIPTHFDLLRQTAFEALLG